MVFIGRYKRSLQDAVPGARIVDLPGAGHYVFLTREEIVVSELRNFVEGLKSIR